MNNKWKPSSIGLTILLYILIFWVVSSTATCYLRSKRNYEESKFSIKIKKYVDKVLNVDQYVVIPGVTIEKAKNNLSISNKMFESCENSRSWNSLQDYVERRLDDYTKTHVVSVKIPETARLIFSSSSGQPDAGKSSFLTGFGMGFFAFALKKLLLPVFIGAQLVKSVMIAMFLPTIVGGLGKYIGKGLSSVSGVSGASTGLKNHNVPAEDFDFKDTNAYNNEDGLQDFMPEPEPSGLEISSSTLSSIPSPNKRYGIGNQRIQQMGSQINDNYYFQKPNKKTDYKVFHKIPSSSILLTSYDPFYSPLLSRLDAVFQQLGLGNDKTIKTEKCRERLVCMMYANPAKYAPFSNLVSAQLSRELNELRKPSSDNPEILRFFRYMKAAKDGQDGEECLAHNGCLSLSANSPSPAILTTFNEINKLVQARKIK